MLGGGF